MDTKLINLDQQSLKLGMKPKPAIQKQPLQSRPQQPSQQQKPQSRPKHSDFSEEYANGVIKVYMNDKVIEGKLIEARRFWIKLESNNEIYYINKAFISHIQPVKPGQTNGNTTPSNTTPTNGNTTPTSTKQKA